MLNVYIDIDNNNDTDTVSYIYIHNYTYNSNDKYKSCLYLDPNNVELSRWMLLNDSHSRSLLQPKDITSSESYSMLRICVGQSEHLLFSQGRVQSFYGGVAGLKGVAHTPMEPAFCNR